MSERICRECGRPESDELEFKGSGNICVDCRKEYMRQYRARNREKLSRQTQEWKEQNRDRNRRVNREHYATDEGKTKHIARVEKTPRTWLSHLLSGTRKRIKNPGPRDKKSGPARVFELDLQMLVDLHEAQEGRCAITGLLMTHRYNDLFAMSIDRIDSKIGYIPSNIQLVCQAANYAKRHHSNESIKFFFESFFVERCRQLAVDSGQSVMVAVQEPGINPCAEIPLVDDDIRESFKAAGEPGEFVEFSDVQRSPLQRFVDVSELGDSLKAEDYVAPEDCPTCDGEGTVHDADFSEGDSDQQMFLMQDTLRDCPDCKKT